MSLITHYFSPLYFVRFYFILFHLIPSGSSYRHTVSPDFPLGPFVSFCFVLFCFSLIYLGSSSRLVYLIPLAFIPSLSYFIVLDLISLYFIWFHLIACCLVSPCLRAIYSKKLFICIPSTWFHFILFGSIWCVFLSLDFAVFHLASLYFIVCTLYDISIPYFTLFYQSPLHCILLHVHYVCLSHLALLGIAAPLVISLGVDCWAPSVFQSTLTTYTAWSC